MRNWSVAVLVAIAVLLGVHVAPMIPGAALAQRRPEKNQVSVPRAWGKVTGVVAGMGGTGILFEASDGTIRFVDAANGTVELTVTRN